MAEKLSMPPKAEYAKSVEEEPLFDVMDKLSDLSDFIKNNPDSPILPQIADMVREMLATEPKHEELIPAESPIESESPVSEPEPTPQVVETVNEPEVVPVVTTERVNEPESAEVESKGGSLSFDVLRTESRPLSDELITGALTGDLRKPGGRDQLMVKSYLDNVPVDDSDKEFAINHQEVINHRNELSDFIKDELKISAPESLRDYLEARKDKFFERLEVGKRSFLTYVTGREKRLDLNQNPLPRVAMDFHGLEVDSTDGSQVDLLENSMGNARANIYIQRELMGRFIHWSSSHYMERKVANDKAQLTKRIYLNPRPQDSVGVFRDVIHALDEKGFAVKAKIYDRSSDSDVMRPYDAEYENVRGDGIVLYATSEEADEVLKTVYGQYAIHEESFKGRGLSTIPFEIADGLGVGDEPTIAGTSLTSHRAEIIGEVVQKVHESGAGDLKDRVLLFKRLWQVEAIKANINPDNPAFNAS